MFARVMTADIPSNRRDKDKIAMVLEAGALPVVAREQGFQGVTFFFDKQTGKLMSITLYDTEAQMKKAHDDIKQVRAGIMDQLGATHIAAESFEIVAQRKP